MPINSKAAPMQLSLTLPTVNAGSAATFAIFNPSFAGEIVSANLANHATLGRDANSYTTLTLVDNTSPTHTLATFTNSTAGNTFTADTFVAGTLNATNTNKRFAISDAIILVKTETGAGSTITTPTLWLEFIPGTYDA